MVVIEVMELLPGLFPLHLELLVEVADELLCLCEQLLLAHQIHGELPPFFLLLVLADSSSLLNRRLCVSTTDEEDAVPRNRLIFFFVVVEAFLGKACASFLFASFELGMGMAGVMDILVLQRTKVALATAAWLSLVFTGFQMPLWQCTTTTMACYHHAG